jgi:hypothetical protein
MSSPTAGRHSVSVIVVVLGLVAAAVGVPYLASGYIRAEQWHLLSRLSTERIGPGRFFRTSVSSYPRSEYDRDVLHARILHLTTEPSPIRSRLDAMVAIREGRIEAATRILSDTAEENPQDAEVLNDLGVLYLALGEQDALNYFKAARLFERARRLSISAAAPVFNAVIAYRQAHMEELANLRLREYTQMAGVPVWTEELDRRPETETELMGRLRRLLTDNLETEAIDLIQEHAANYRHLAIEYLMAPANSTPNNTLDFILTYCERILGDSTVAALREASRGPQKTYVADARSLVHSGIAARSVSLLRSRQRSCETRSFPGRRPLD